MPAVDASQGDSTGEKRAFNAKKRLSRPVELRSESPDVPVTQTFPIGEMTGKTTPCVTIKLNYKTISTIIGSEPIRLR